jgi:hypothetical protein
MERAMPGPPESPGPSDEPARRRSAAPPGSAEDALRRLEERLDRASEAAERLMAQAAEAAAEATGGSLGAGAGGGGGGGNPGGAADPPKPPPAGWQSPEEPTRARTPELDPFVALVQAMRDLIPPELQRRLVAALRELLLALRALIDWYLERLERRREQAAEVQDIPIL